MKRTYRFPLLIFKLSYLIIICFAFSINSANGQEINTNYCGLSFVNGEFWLTARKGGGRRSKDGVNWMDLPATTPAGRFAQSPRGTIINVARGRYDIKRSTDGKNWKSVFNAPDKKNVTWDTAFVVYGKVNKIAK